MKFLLKLFVALIGLAIVFCREGTAADAPAVPTNAANRAKSAPKPAELFPDKVVAKGKGFEIKRSQLESSVTSIKSTAVARGQRIPDEQIVMMEQQELERLIQIQILLTKATDADKAKGRETSDKRFETVKTRAGGDEPLGRQLKSLGMSAEELHAKMLDGAIAEAVLERDLKVNISDAEVKKYYDDNPAKFEQPEMVRASHILLATKDQAGTELTPAQKSSKLKQMEEILKRARAGDDFAKLAKEYSEDPGSKDQGGEYKFPRGKMVKEFEAAAFSLQTNQVSEIVTTQYGYHIIKLSEKIPAQKVELAKVEQDVKDYLKGQAVQKELAAYMEKAKKDVGLQILDEKLKPVDSVFNALPATGATEPKKP